MMTQVRRNAIQQNSKNGKNIVCSDPYVYSLRSFITHDILYNFISHIRKRYVEKLQQ